MAPKRSEYLADKAVGGPVGQPDTPTGATDAQHLGRCAVLIGGEHHPEDRGASDTLERVAVGLPVHLISGISRLRWLRVLAQETTFRFRDADDHLPQATAARLGATYALGGTVEVVRGRTLTSIELWDLRTGAVVWAEQLQGRLDDFHQTRAAISGAVLAAREIQSPLNEALRARSCPAEQLDAWALATAYLERATQLDPNFASAFAALSFTSYRMAAMKWTPERNRPENGQLSLDRSVQLSPSYAKGYHSPGLAAMLAGQVGECLADIERAMTLSPLDPMLCAMQACKAISLHVAGRPDEAVIWRTKASGRPMRISPC